MNMYKNNLILFIKCNSILVLLFIINQVLSNNITTTTESSTSLRHLKYNKTDKDEQNEYDTSTTIKWVPSGRRLDLNLNADSTEEITVFTTPINYHEESDENYNEDETKEELDGIDRKIVEDYYRTVENLLPTTSSTPLPPVKNIDNIQRLTRPTKYSK